MACQGNCNEANGQGQCTASGQCQCASGYSGYDCGSGDDSVLWGLSKAAVIGISCAVAAVLLVGGFAVFRYSRLVKQRAAVSMSASSQTAALHVHDGDADAESQVAYHPLTTEPESETNMRL